MNLQNRTLRTISWIILSSFLVQGCTNYYAYDMGAAPELATEINRKAETSIPAIRMHDGYKYSATELVMQPDSSTWYTGDGILPVHYPTSDIYTITFTYRKSAAKKD